MDQETRGAEKTLSYEKTSGLTGGGVVDSQTYHPPPMTNLTEYLCLLAAAQRRFSILDARADAGCMQAWVESQPVRDRVRYLVGFIATAAAGRRRPLP